MMKRFICLLLVFMMLALLSACDSSVRDTIVDQGTVMGAVNEPKTDGGGSSAQNEAPTPSANTGGTSGLFKSEKERMLEKAGECISFGTIIEASTENKARAKLNYCGKTLLISGDVFGIESDYVTVGDFSYMYEPDIYLTVIEVYLPLEDLATLEVGQQINFVGTTGTDIRTEGKETGSPIFEVAWNKVVFEMKNAYLVEYANDPEPQLHSEANGVGQSQSATPIATPVPATTPQPEDTLVYDKAHVLLDSGDIDGAYALVTELMKANGRESDLEFLSPHAEYGHMEFRSWPSCIVIIADELRIRQIPSTSGEIVGMTEKGQHYFPFDSCQAEGYTWYKVGLNEWIADDNGKYVSEHVIPYIEDLIESAKGKPLVKTDVNTFLGHTVEEVVAVFGDGFSLANFSADGPLPGLYYEDGRTEYAFLYTDKGRDQTSTIPLYADYIVTNIAPYQDIEKQARKDMIEYQLMWLEWGGP